MSPAEAAAPEAPELVSPAAGHTFRLHDVQLFTVRVDDGDGDRWVAVLEIVNLDNGRTTTAITPPSGAGEYAGTVAVPPLAPGRYQWRAKAMDASGATGAWSVLSLFRVGSNTAPSVPTLIAPADGATVRRIGNEPFSISALDADADPFVGTVVVRRADGSEAARFSTSPAPPGGVSSGLLLPPLSEGAYTWAATATDVHGASSGFSAPRSFSVGPPATAGVGALAGSLRFTPGLSPGSCEPSTSTWALTSGATVVNSALSGYVGILDLSGSGSSACEGALAGVGTVTLDATGVGPTGSRIKCTALSGSYTRLGHALWLSLAGPCEVNSFPISRVVLVAALSFSADSPGAGLVARIDQASVGGAFVVRPE